MAKADQIEPMKKDFSTLQYASSGRQIQVVVRWESVPRQGGGTCPAAIIFTGIFLTENEYL